MSRRFLSGGLCLGGFCPDTGPNRPEQTGAGVPPPSLQIFEMIPGVQLLTGFHTSCDLVSHPFVNYPCWYLIIAFMDYHLFISISASPHANFIFD